MDSWKKGQQTLYLKENLSFRVKKEQEDPSCCPFKEGDVFNIQCFIGGSLGWLAWV